MPPAGVRNWGDEDAGTVDCDGRSRRVGGRRVRFESEGEVEKQVEGRIEGGFGGGWRVEKEKGECRGGRGGGWGEEKGCRPGRGFGGGDVGGGEVGGCGCGCGCGLEVQEVGGSGGCLVSGSHGRAGQDGVASRTSRAQNCD